MSGRLLLVHNDKLIHFARLKQIMLLTTIVTPITAFSTPLVLVLLFLIEMPSMAASLQELILL